MAKAMITTSDNPYSPFTQYDQWRAYDEHICGYYTSQYLARIMSSSPELSGADIEQDIEDAIDEIIHMNLPLYSPVTNTRATYTKVYAPE